MPLAHYLPEQMGSTSLSPRGAFVAGSYAELVLTYTAGTFGIDDSGHLKISLALACPIWPSRNFDRPDGSRTTRACGRATAPSSRSGVDRINIRPWVQHAVHPGQARLPARAARPDHGAVRRPVGGSPGCGCRPTASRPSSSRCSSMRSRPMSSPSCQRSPEIALVAGPAGALESDLADARRGRVSRSAWPSLPRIAGATRRTLPTTTLALRRHRRRCGGLPETGRRVSRGDGPLVDRGACVPRRRAICELSVLDASGQRVMCGPIRCASCAAAALRHFWGDLHGAERGDDRHQLGGGLLRLCARSRLSRHRRAIRATISRSPMRSGSELNAADGGV